MSIILRRHAARFSRFWCNWQQFWRLFHQYARLADLERLITWANRKRLYGPRSYYQRLLEAESERLLRCAICAPQLSLWARRIYGVSVLLNPPPRYRAQGSAAQYQYANLTN